MSSLTQRDLAAVLEKLLPPLDPTKVVLGAVMEDLAQHFGVTKRDIKDNHKEQLKELITDMLHLCKGGPDKENEPHSDAEDENKPQSDAEDEDDEIVTKKQPSKRARGRIEEESDEEDGSDADGKDDNEDDDVSGDSEEEEEMEERQPKRRKKASTVTRKEKAATAKRKMPVTRKAADKPMESEGLAALKELARVAGLLSPAVYAILKKLDSEDEQKNVLRERLQDAGVQFSSPYPKKSDIAAAKRKREKEKELDGIDTSLIISGGRSRRSSAPSFATKFSDDDDEEADEDMDEDQEELHNQNEEESDAHEASEASDESEAEF